MTLKQALDRSCRRMPTADMKFFAIVLNLQQQTGGNLAETLDNLEQLLRRRKQMALKVKAFASEAKTSSMIVGSLPFLMLALLSVINWNYVEVLFYSHSGNLLLAAAGGSLLLGVVCLVKLATFEI